MRRHARLRANASAPRRALPGGARTSPFAGPVRPIATPASLGRSENVVPGDLFGIAQEESSQSPLPDDWFAAIAATPDPSVISWVAAPSQHVARIRRAPPCGASARRQSRDSGAGRGRRAPKRGPHRTRSASPQRARCESLARHHAGHASRQTRASGACRSLARAPVKAVAGGGSRSRVQRSTERRQRGQTRAAPIAHVQQRAPSLASSWFVADGALSAKLPLSPGSGSDVRNVESAGFVNSFRSSAYPR